jgi:hypothetical protein
MNLSLDGVLERRRICCCLKIHWLSGVSIDVSEGILTRFLIQPGPAVGSVVSILSADHQGGGCETEVVEGGDKLAHVDDGVVMRIGRDGLLRAIDVNGVEPFEAAASPRLSGDLYTLFNGHLAQITT